MKKKVILMLGALLSWGGLVQATNIDFNSVNPIGTIQAGDNYDFVTLHDSATVTLTGGTIVNALYAYDTSTFNFQGGTQGSVLRFHGSSTANMTGGTSNGCFQMYDNSVLNISGGIVSGPSGVEIGNSSVLNLFGGDLHGYFYVQNIVNIYGRDLTITPYYTWPHNVASGHWADGTPFQFILGRAQIYNPQVVFHEIPELATLLLFGIGAFLLRKSH